MNTTKINLRTSSNTGFYKSKKESFPQKDLFFVSDNVNASFNHQGNDALPMIYKSSILLSQKSDNNVFKKINQKYRHEFLSLIQRYKNPDSPELGLEIVKLSNRCNKEIVKFAEKNNIQYISFLNLT